MFKVSPTGKKTIPCTRENDGESTVQSTQKLSFSLIACVKPTFISMCLLQLRMIMTENIEFYSCCVYTVMSQECYLIGHQS